MATLQELSSVNFFAVCDVAEDIMEKVEIAEDKVVFIPIIRQVIRYLILFPGDSIGTRDTYGNYRTGGLRYLKENGVIESFDFISDGHRWDTKIRIMLDPEKFKKFYKELQKARDERVRESQSPPKTQAHSASESLPLSVVRKVRLLDALFEEWELTPKKDYAVGSGIYMIQKSGGVRTASYDTYSSWIRDARLTDYDQLESLLNVFREEGLIQWEMVVDGIENAMEIKFPKDFEERYKVYRAKLLAGHSMPLPTVPLEWISANSVKANRRSVQNDIDKKVPPVHPSESIKKDDSGKPALKEFPRLRSGTQWKHFTFKFISDEVIHVSVSNRNNIDEVMVTYEDLGCRDGRKKSKHPPYDSQWRLLLRLAKAGGEIEPGGEFAHPSNEKAKEILTERLQNYFHIPDDPFYAVDSRGPNKKQGSYKFRPDIFLPSNEIMIDLTEDDGNDELGRDIKESYSEEARVINDADD